MNKFSSRAVLVVMFMLCGAPQSRAQDDFNVCQKSDLLRALAYVYYGCGTICHPDVIKAVDGETIDRATLIGILSSPRLVVRHVFFPMKQTSIKTVLDWDIRGSGSKRDQLMSLKQNVDRGGMLFIIGKASTVGNPKTNMDLSYARMWSVRQFLVNDVKVDCPEIRGGWFGEDAFQFEESDAARLSIQPYEYRSPAPSEYSRLGSAAYEEMRRQARYTLNQAVHVVFVPCGPKTLFAEHRSLIWLHHRASLTATFAQDRQKEHRISTVLFAADLSENKKAFVDELCAYCTGRGPRPVGSPADASAADACRLARALREDDQECPRR